MSKKRSEMALARGLRPQMRRKERGFTGPKQDAFFEALEATCNVSAAASAAGVCKATVYVHRRNSAAFRARWAVTVREAYARLELAMLERALNGSVKTVTRADGSVESVHEYPNAVALTLLRRHQELAAEAGQEHDPAEIEELRERLAAKIERLRKRLDKEAAARGNRDGGGGE